MNPAESSFVVTASLSNALTGIVVLTFLVFPSMRRNKIFMEIIACMASCNFLGTLPFSFTVYPRNGTALCYIEAFLYLYFYPVSWLYTLLLTYLLRGLAVHGRLLVSRAFLHSFCLGIPLVLTLLMLTTNIYGVEPQDQGKEICTYSGNPYTGFVWHISSFYTLYLLCCALMLGFLLELRYLEHTGDSRVTSKTFQVAKQSLVWYPFAMFVSWIPRVIFILALGYHVSSPPRGPFPDALRCLRNLSGAFIAAIFFWKCPEARGLWLRLLVPSTAVKTNQNQHEESVEYTDDDLPIDEELSRRMTRGASARIDSVQLTRELEAVHGREIRPSQSMVENEIVKLSQSSAGSISTTLSLTDSSVGHA